MSWFESTPLGRILNRFSQDVQAIDCDVMRGLVAFLDCILGILQILFVVSASLPAILPFFGPVIFTTYFVAYRYIIASREMKRLESIYRSPILIQFSESYLGLSTIRAFRKEKLFFRELCRRIDNFNRMHLYLWLSNRWLNIRIALLGAVVAWTAGIFIILYGGVDSGTAGIVLLYSLTFTENLTWVARTHADCQMNLNSVERIKEYSEIEQEAYGSDASNGCRSLETIMEEMNVGCSVLDTESRGSNWPHEGKVEFKSISLSYKTSQNVLKNVSFIVEPGKKVGLVGRSGAGKSSCVAALFRLTEPSSGSIIIDGVDILQMPLQTLRAGIAIVPQDPILFEGSVRSNLDPFDEFSDDDLWGALKKVKLEDVVATMSGLSLSEKKVSEKGTNFSMGQRQLLCMARAIVKKSKILVMDEATASVDHETDALIQNTVRHELSCTVICVAHRLQTIAFYDKVVVMSEGCVAEFGSPLELMLKEGSIFKSMCVSSGDYDGLLQIARMPSA